MKILFSTLLLCLGALSVGCQSLFIKAYGDAATNEEARAITRTDDGNFLIVGYRTTYHLKKALAFKINPSGAVIWSKVYTGTNGNPAYGEEFHDVIYLAGYYYCVGVTYNFINNPTFDPNKGDVFLVKLKPDGDVVWAKNFGNTADQSGTFIGNEVGLGIMPNYLGGVMISVRINSASPNNQNTGFISVDTDGKVRWAYQYDLTSHPTANELADRLWKADGQGYVAGGWFDDFAGHSGGMLMKLDKDGNLKWAKRTDWLNPPDTTTLPLFESMYSGYYNYRNKKIYSTDYFNPGTNTNLRAANIMTNLSVDGTVPSTAGGNVQFKSIHYATPSSNNHRSYLFPLGDGAAEMMLATYKNTYTSGVTSPALLAKINTDLSQPIAWQRQLAFESAHNKIVDVITCDDHNQDIICVGTMRDASSYNILVARVSTVTGSQTCIDTDTRTTTTAEERSSNLPLQRIDLNTTGCSNSCWADDDLILGLTVLNDTLNTFNCGGIMDSLTLPEPLVFITPSTTTISGGSKIQFSFGKTPQHLIFEIKSPTGEITYYRTMNNTSTLTTGINVATGNGFASGTYSWSIMATYTGEIGIEMKEGEIIVP